MQMKPQSWKIGPQGSSLFYFWRRSGRNRCLKESRSRKESIWLMYIRFQSWAYSLGKLLDPAGLVRSRKIETNVALLVVFVSIAAWKKTQEPETQGWAKAEPSHVLWRWVWGSRQSRFLLHGWVPWVSTTSEGWVGEKDHQDLTTSRIHPCVGKPNTIKMLLTSFYISQSSTTCGHGYTPIRQWFISQVNFAFMWSPVGNGVYCGKCWGMFEAGLLMGSAIRLSGFKFLLTIDSYCDLNLSTLCLICKRHFTL